MQPSAHLASTYIVWWIINRIYGTDLFSLILAVVFGVLIDIDAVVFGSKHRTSPLHSIGFWIACLLVIYFLQWVYWWTLFFGIFHLSLDMIDYRVSIFYPFSTKLIGLGYAEKRMNLIPGENSLLDFTKAYLKIRPLLFTEILLILVAIILLIVDPYPLF